MFKGNGAPSIGEGRDTDEIMLEVFKKMCACAAAGGRPGSGRSAVWVDWIFCWLATCTVRGTVAGCLFSIGVELVTKWPLLPESSIVRGGEGPSVDRVWVV